MLEPQTLRFGHGCGAAAGRRRRRPARYWVRTHCTAQDFDALHSHGHWAAAALAAVAARRLGMCLRAASEMCRSSAHLSSAAAQSWSTSSAFSAWLLVAATTLPCQKLSQQCGMLWLAEASSDAKSSDESPDAFGQQPGCALVALLCNCAQVRCPSMHVSSSRCARRHGVTT